MRRHNRHYQTPRRKPKDFDNYIFRFRGRNYPYIFVDEELNELSFEKLDREMRGDSEQSFNDFIWELIENRRRRE